MPEETTYFIEVMPASQRYHRAEPLTYHHVSPLEQGQVVIVEMQRERVPAVVIKVATKPRFTTKPIVRVIDGVQLTKPLIELSSWLHDYYPAPGGSTMQLFLPSFLAQQSRPKKGDAVVAVSGLQKKEFPKLTQDQSTAVSRIVHGREHSFLLHGNTGTGKTRVYVELAREVLNRNQSVIILTPEIGLTPQLTNYIESAFPGKTVVVHSELTAAERRDRWLGIATATHPLIVIGPRSALFSPVKALGLIVMDEAHDSAYKQEQSPYYQTSRVAAQLAQRANAKLVLGTATPSISDYYIFSEKQLPIISMNQIPGQPISQKSVALINLRDKSEFTQSGILSDRLIAATRKALSSGKQTLLFLNRRGTARVVLCQNCGWQDLCPHCDLPLTFHGDQHKLRCHTCGFSSGVPLACVECGSTDIIFQSIGTKAVVSEATKLFPEARVVRFDSDSGAESQLHHVYTQVQTGAVDIIVGTQMIAKGLDLPKLAVVGAVIADTSLYFPDYSADERTYQLIHQVCGRVGRSHGAGEVIVQTYSPDNIVLQAAVHNDYPLYYKQQISERKAFHFPPFFFFLKLSCSRKSQSAAQKVATKLYSELQQHKGIELIGPSPAFSERSNDTYKWQIIVRATNRTRLVAIINHLPANWAYDIDPGNLL